MDVNASLLTLVLFFFSLFHRWFFTVLSLPASCLQKALKWPDLHIIPVGLFSLLSIRKWGSYNHQESCKPWHPFVFPPCSPLQLCYGAFHHRSRLHSAAVAGPSFQASLREIYGSWASAELSFRCVWPSGANSITVYPQLISSACPYLWLQITELQPCLHIRVQKTEAREQGGSSEKVIKGSCWTEKGLKLVCRYTVRFQRFWGCRPSSMPRAGREISAVQCSLSHPTGVARGSIASPQLLHMRDLVLELQPVKMLSRSKTFERGLLHFASERDLPFSFSLFAYLWAAAL